MSVVKQQQRVGRGGEKETVVVDFFTPRRTVKDEFESETYLAFMEMARIEERQKHKLIGK